MLRFMMPPAYRTYTVELVNIPDCCVRHRYIRCHTTPVRIILQEHTCMLHNITNLTYLFHIKGNNLILDSCIETSHLGEATFLNNGYAYIRIPEKENELLGWEYTPFEDINVYCTAKIEQQKIIGITYEILTINRTFLSDCSTHTSTECYVAGLGLRSRQDVTLDCGSIHLPDILNYSLN